MLFPPFAHLLVCKFADYLSTRSGRFEGTEDTNCLLFEFSCISTSNPPEVFLGKRVQKVYSIFTEHQPCRSAISVKLLCKVAPVNLLHIFRTPFYKNIFGGLLLYSQEDVTLKR